MIKIYDERGTGKTSRLLLLAVEHKSIFVTMYPLYVKQLAQRLKINVEDVDFFTPSELKKHWDDSRIRGRTMVIDDLDVISGSALCPGCKLIAFTATTFDRNDLRDRATKGFDS